MFVFEIQIFHSVCGVFSLRSFSLKRNALFETKFLLNLTRNATLFWAFNRSLKSVKVVYVREFTRQRHTSRQTTDQLLVGKAVRRGTA